MFKFSLDNLDHALASGLAGAPLASLTQTYFAGQTKDDVPSVNKDLKRALSDIDGMDVGAILDVLNVHAARYRCLLSGAKIADPRAAVATPVKAFPEHPEQLVEEAPPPPPALLTFKAHATFSRSIERLSKEHHKCEEVSMFSTLIMTFHSQFCFLP